MTGPLAGRQGSRKMTTRPALPEPSAARVFLSSGDPMIDVHYWPTPNGKKVTIALEELELPYRVVACNIGRGDQFEDDFLAISPNNRMPAIVDHEPAGGGEPISVFESGAILLYLAEKAGRLWPAEPHAHWEVVQWVVWQMANQGPKHGECGHFRRLEDREGDQSYAVRRFSDEVNRLCGVMNCRLYDHPYMAGDAYTIADIACYPWVANLERYGENVDDFKHLKRWIDELAARPAVKRGMEVGSDFGGEYEKLPKEEIERLTKLLYNQRARKAPDGV